MSDSNQVQAPVTWTVTGQTQGTQLDGTGNFVPGVTVTFRTGSGTLGQVFLSDTAYTVDAVRAAVAERAAVIESVSNLTHES